MQSFQSSMMHSQIHAFPTQYSNAYTQGFRYQFMPQNATFVVWEMRKEKHSMQNECLLGNSDTDFLDDKKLVLLAIELGVTERKDLPDLRVIINDLI